MLNTLSFLIFSRPLTEYGLKIQKKMKNMYATILIILGLGTGMILFAQSPEGSGSEGNTGINPKPDIQIHEQKEMEDRTNIQKIDSSYTWSWQDEKELPEEMQERVKDVIEKLGNGFYFHFNDSTLFPEGMQGFFNEDFHQLFKDFEWRSEIFDEKFHEQLEKLNDFEFHFQWDEDFNQKLEDRLKELEERLNKFYQDRSPYRGKAI
jgi:hypothetical protein